MDVMNVKDIKAYLQSLQNHICERFLELDRQAAVNQDCWSEPGRIQGDTRIISGGSIIERGAVNFSHVTGSQLPASASARHPGIAGANYQALGISLIIHPLNPYVPMTHMNIRAFVADKPVEHPAWWFGGGYDLTPYYPFIEDCQHWHQVAHDTCQPFGEEIYPRYKKWCDEYFYLKHRQEARGIGGLFFDDLNDSQWPFATCFEFMQAVGNSFTIAYLPLVERRAATPFGTRERDFQLYRRGRYVEFNLVYDRGTRFGLESNGRTESILVSLPPTANWEYNWQPTPNTPEALLYEKFLVPTDWLATEKSKDSVK